MSLSWWRSEADATVKIVTPGSDAVGQLKGAQSVDRERRLADKHTVQTQQRYDQRCEFAGERPAGHDISGRGVEMSERHAAGKSRAGGRQRLEHIAEQEKFGRRYAIRMGRYVPLANIDLAVWKKLAEMIISSAVAEAEI
jgi:hypothetical protein